MAWCTITQECPYCNILIDVDVERWSGHTECSSCKTMIEVEYDEQWECDAEYWYLRKFDYEGLDYFSSKIHIK